MASRQPVLSRRLFATSALIFPLSACAKPNSGTTIPAESAPVPSQVDPATVQVHLSSLERKYNVRLGAYAVATGSGTYVAYRADERFAFCSTFKTLAAAAVLQRHPMSYLDTVVSYTKEDVNSISPITENHIGTGMTIGQLCDAAIRYSDGTAGNLLMRDIGGPAQLTAYLRALGDTTGRMDQYEPDMNRDLPDDPRDTTTPQAIAGDYHDIVLGNALPAEKQSLLKNWLQHSTTGANTIRAGVPSSWMVANKTGHGDYGRANDIAVVWPPGGKPLVIAIMSDRAGYEAEPQYSVIAEATAHIVSLLHY